MKSNERQNKRSKILELLRETKKQIKYKGDKKTQVYLQIKFERVQFSSVAQSCLTLCDPMNRSTPGLPSITNSRSLLKLCDAIQPSHPLLFPSPPAPNPSQHQGLFQ